MVDDTETLAARAWAIVHEQAPAWWNAYTRMFPKSKAGEIELRRQMAHHCVVAAITPLIEANARLERERDEMRSTAAGVTLAMTKQRDAATSALAKAEGERGRMAAALEPFALVAETEIGGAEDDRDWFTTTALKLKVGHFRRALAALTPAPEAPKDGE